MVELITLDENFQPNRLVENYESLIWTERYSENGDFEIQTTDIQRALELLPRETYISLRESTVPMKVEDYRIHKAKNAAPKLSIFGRTFETVLEDRVSVKELPADSGRPAWRIPAGKAPDAAYLAMRTVLGDYPRYRDNQRILTMRSPAVSPLDAIPEIDLTLPADFETLVSSFVPGDRDYATGDLVVHDEAVWRYLGSGPDGVPETVAPDIQNPTWERIPFFEIPAKELYVMVMELLHTRNRGFKSVRPTPSSNKVGIEIYNGADLRNDVVFDARFDQFDDTTYLLSQRGSKNVGYVYGSTGSQIVLKTASEEPSGLDRRVLLVDGVDENLQPLQPLPPDGEDPLPATNTAAHYESIRRSRGLVELYKYNATALFDGQVAMQVANGYNTTYHLGDILMLTGEYGLSQAVRVKEFIRTSDSSGEKAYPTFEAVS